MPKHRFSLPQGVFAAAALLSALVPARAPASDDSAELQRVVPVPSDQQIPLGDFFRPAQLQEPKLNRSGTRIAALVTAGEDHHLLLVYDVKTQKYEVLGRHGDTDVSDVHWLNDTRLVYQVSSQKLYGIGLFAANAGDLAGTYPLLQYFGTSIIAVPRSDRLSPLVWNSFNGLQAPFVDQGAAIINSSQVSRQTGVDLTTVSSPDAFNALIQPVRENNDLHIEDRYPIPAPTGAQTVGYIADKDGNLEFANVSLNGFVTLYRLADRSWIKCPVDMDHWTLFGSGNKPGEIAARPPHTQGKPSPLVLLDGPSGARGETLVDDKGYDFVGGVYRDPVNGEIIGASVQREGPYMVWFSEAHRKLQDLLNHSFPGLVVRIVGWNDAQDFLVVAAYSDRQPVVYDWVDVKKHSSGLFKQALPWIDAKRMQPENIIRFKTRDGRQLDAYLTLPAGASREHPAPLVVVPHGGPWARDTWGFDGEAQFLANRGYAVLKPNYRGSPGYSWMFPEEDEWEFVKMSHDVTDVTQALITTGLVDPARIAIMGGSFGGYLTLKGLVDEPDLYKCGVAISGVYDWEQLIRDKKYDATQYGSGEYGQLLRRLGDPRKEPAKFDEIAPVRHVDRVKVPIFVSHGGEDYNVDLGQATRLIGELKKYHVPYEADIVGDEGHGMLYFSHRLDQYARILAFLQKYVPANAPP